MIHNKDVKLKKKTVHKIATRNINKLKNLKRNIACEVSMIMSCVVLVNNYLWMYLCVHAFD